jgi:hypothetical protein
VLVQSTNDDHPVAIGHATQFFGSVQELPEILALNLCRLEPRVIQLKLNFVDPR